MKRIVIFASGSGTNAENIIRFFQGREDAKVVQVLSNKKDAKVLERANTHEVSAFSFNRTAFYQSEDVLNLLKATHPDLIVLAGFLWKFPTDLIEAFPNRIINLHPALLPKYGGKGMYGMHVHKAVIANREETSGITIHYVNEQYDEGAIIFQASTKIEAKDTPEILAAKIHSLEYEHFPMVIAQLLSDQNK
ncbi:phosphoribosylglycinamide formyltransferase [Sungkyunkwania multivorans]|uniref:Phosphoribosylglycinamide formyltransferase n=1 Tax=Sungkyunkwania multivorans TaxID=1173618 RepID=A0ABW3D1C1_9FLAO